MNKTDYRFAMKNAAESLWYCGYRKRESQSNEDVNLSFQKGYIIGMMQCKGELKPKASTYAMHVIVYIDYKELDAYPTKEEFVEAMWNLVSECKWKWRTTDDTDTGKI